MFSLLSSHLKSVLMSNSLGPLYSNSEGSDLPEVPTHADLEHRRKSRAWAAQDLSLSATSKGFTFSVIPLIKTFNKNFNKSL